jgi:hypothetical protein
MATSMQIRENYAVLQAFNFGTLMSNNNSTVEVKVHHGGDYEQVVLSTLKTAATVSSETSVDLT